MEEVKRRGWGFDLVPVAQGAEPNREREHRRQKKRKMLDSSNKTHNPQDRRKREKIPFSVGGGQGYGKGSSRGKGGKKDSKNR